MARSIAAKAMESAEGKIDEAGFYHLTLGAGIMIDKARLLTGESTENIAIQSRNEIVALDRLADALSRALIARQVDSSADESSPPILPASGQREPKAG